MTLFRLRLRYALFQNRYRFHIMLCVYRALRFIGHLCARDVYGRCCYDVISPVGMLMFRK